MTAQEGDKLPPVESKETAPLMGFFKHMIPGFRLAYKQKQINLAKDPGFYKTPQQTTVRDSNFVITPIIKKPIPQDKGFFKIPSLFASKKQEGGLIEKSDNTRVQKPIPGMISPDSEALSLEKKNLTKAQYGLKFRGSNKSNRFISEPYPLQTPEVIVNSTKPYRFDRRQLNLGNGRSVISDVLFKEYENGKYQGDVSDIIAGRTIYQTPKGNDTIYGGYMQGGLGNGQWIENNSGYMPIMSSSPNGKANFYRNIKKSFVYPSSSYRDNTKEIQAFQRAKQGN